MKNEEEESARENGLTGTTSSGSASPARNKSRKRASLDSEKSMVLSVNVVDHEDVAEHVIPLKVYDPSLRRSLRSTTNIYRSDLTRNAEAHVCLVPGTPETTRFEKGGKDENLSEMGNGLSAGSSKRKRCEEDNRPALHGSENVSRLRSPGAVSKGNSKKGVLAICKRVSSDKRESRKSGLSGIYSRKSPRLNPNLMSELLALPGAGSGRSDSGKCFTRVKRLRNRNVVVHVEIEKEDTVRKDSVGKDGIRGRYQSNVSKLEFKLTDALLGSRPAGSCSSIAGEKDFYLPKPSPKGDFPRSSSGKNGFGSMIEESSITRTKHSELTLVSGQSGLGCIDFIDRDLEVGDNCFNSVKMQFESSEALGKTELKKCDFGDDGELGLSPVCLTPEDINFDVPDVSGKCHSENMNYAGDMNSSGACSNPEKIELAIPVKTAGEIWESNVFSERCLRSRKIAFQITGAENVDKNSCVIKKGIRENKEQTVKIKMSNEKQNKQKTAAFFIGSPIPEEEAQARWHWRYELKSRQPKNKGWILNAGAEDETILNVESHYAQANIDGYVFNIDDCAYIKGEGKEKHIGRILEFFKTVEGEDYFRVQWFFKAEDTVIKQEAAFHNKKRLFYSSLMNDNLLDCIISKVKIVEVPPAVGLKLYTIPPADFYYDMEYSVEYSTFRNLQSSNSFKINDSYSSQTVDSFHAPSTASQLDISTGVGPLEGTLTLLDLFAGCGGMSTGLCLGTKLSNINLVKRWAVDLEESACDSFKLNHPETQVINASAEDYLELLKRWEKLCQRYVFNNLKNPLRGSQENMSRDLSNESSELEDKVPAGELEVASLIDICYGDPNETTRKKGVHFKVRWKGYGPDDDTWEPMEGLGNCEECIKDFVQKGLRDKILPLPGEADVICGGPPCQGISGYNRHRNVEEPLTDEKNQQIVVFMNIVEFLKPKYVLMENVVDILRLDGGSLGRYALSRLVHMKYQARLGTVAAGCYGLPQFRLRVFIWGALPTERLPPFPLPTHDVVVRYWPPLEFERNTVAYDEGQPRKLEEALFLRDAISDLPPVKNDETREVMDYDLPPESGFQEYIRSSVAEMMGSTSTQTKSPKNQFLYDHRPYRLNEDNYLRVCQVPHRKGANFRDLPGLIVGEDNVVHRDENHPVLPSGEPLVPDCSLRLEKGKSKRPFARLWWDETVATVLTFPHYKNQAILHPEQDRVLTIREFARLQGFPDFYRFSGTIKERYSQVGNAVAIPVGRALGYTLGMAFRKLTGDEPLMTMPPNFSFMRPVNGEIVELGN